MAAAFSHEYTHIATDCLSSLHQLKKQILYPEKHRQHLGVNAQIRLLREGKGREGKGYIAAPACGGSLAEAKRACNQTIANAVPGGIPFYNIAWLAREEARPTTSELSSPIPNLI
eukprot:1153823-Pelagomonas_calceolata.AAC.3